MDILSNLKYKLKFLKVLNSPFVPLKLKWYFGEIAYGTPYFLPRKWVKGNKEDAKKIWDKYSDRTKSNIICFQKYEDWEENWLKHESITKPVKYLWFDFVTLGWKTKWSEFRFEWSPMISIVLFGKQLVVKFKPKVDEYDMAVIEDCYWEAWLTWENDTDKSKSTEERLEQLVKKYSCTWGNKEGKTDYYQLILKKKYLKLYNEINKA